MNTMKTARNLILLSAFLCAAGVYVSAFHDCIEASRAGRERRRRQFFKAGIHQHQVPESNPIASTSSNTGSSCSGGLCLGMKNGPHEGGNASYPVSWDKNLLRGITIRSTMTVPSLPSLTDGITYYIWTDAFFGDGGLGRMNQLVSADSWEGARWKQRSSQLYAQMGTSSRDVVVWESLFFRDLQYDHKCHRQPCCLRHVVSHCCRRDSLDRIPIGGRWGWIRCRNTPLGVANGRRG